MPLMKLKLFITLAFLFIAAGVFAQKTYTNEIGIQTDNDSYLLQGSDRYYTDGYYMYFRHALSTDSSKTMQNKVLGFEFGQKIFNPQSGSIANAEGVDDPQYVDRPFAAYLYVGSTLNLLYKNESSLKLSAQLGIVGPSALGKQIQDWVHDNFGFYHPSGWEYQIANDPELNLSAEYKRLLARTGPFDATLDAYGNLGNGFSGAGFGPIFRLGNFNQLFNSVTTQSTVTKNTSIAPLHKNEIFFYYKPMLNYVAYDATIQGSLFRKRSPDSEEITLDKEPFIFSNQLGVAFTANRFEFDIAAIFQTKTDKEMQLSEQWGTITGLYRFR
jgi:lipid A 3-O-deacylase